MEHIKRVLGPLYTFRPLSVPPGSRGKVGLWVGKKGGGEREKSMLRINVLSINHRFFLGEHQIVYVEGGESFSAAAESFGWLGFFIHLSSIRLKYLSHEVFYNSDKFQIKDIPHSLFK